MSKDVTTPTISQIEALIQKAQYVEKLEQMVMLSADNDRATTSSNYWKSLNRTMKGMEVLERSAWTELARMRKMLESNALLIDSELTFVRVWAKANLLSYNRRIKKLISKVCELNHDISTLRRRAATGGW